MRTQMSNTSLAAFRSIEPVLQPKESEVLDVFVIAFMRDMPLEITREALAKHMGWKETSVGGRVNSLIKKGRLEEIAGGKTASGYSAKLIRLPVVEQ
ncbi:hypothetical protein HEAR2297 [Herminiimonas arsenicoxydans]|uniref:Transcriptional regulator n=1 Tax=Herminiimonas arsenicoxydans TaxID=204773 RepID=A4G7E1_HERAR|nr:hypothetical protein HEAR2297 [Herminiimonas arsenicoxydans]